VDVDVPGIVVINERTGTIVVGGTVSISDTAVAQGDLVVKIKEQFYVSQPTTPFTDRATTEVVPDTALSVEEQEGYLINVPRAVTVEELANALNAIGASPRDLISIFQALERAGALQAKLEMM
jgi:flagellar P-ring protein precursor FlgI